MRVYAACVFGLLLSLSAAVTAKDIAGWIEKASIYPGGIEVKAKLDTGARTSSLHCDCIEEVERDGENWVSFTLTNYKGESVRLERKVQRVASIKRHFGNVQQRAVILLGICVGNIYRETEVSLVDRSGFNYQMLIGRSFMEGELIVDPGETFISPPRCNVGAASVE